jgi:anthranilate synthase/aminodeoxychorismate synthase-like glutamine amidotransferase
MVLLIDNYDSFVHNLARYVRELGRETRVLRNDAPGLAPALAEATHLIVSPGPRAPAQAGAATAAIVAAAGRIPVLGVCLGHQCVAEAFGGTVARAARPLHGRASPIHHDGCGIFGGIPTPFAGARYHSLIVPRDGVPPVLEIVAWTGDGEVMAVRHREHPVWGVQFHPESILTEHGHRLLGNFLALPAAGNGSP